MAKDILTLNLDGEDALNDALSGLKPSDEITATVKLSVNEINPGVDAVFSVLSAEVEEPESEGGEDSGMMEGNDMGGEMPAAILAVVKGKKRSASG